MGAEKNLKLFNRSAALIKKLGQDRLDKYLVSEYFGDNEDRDSLNKYNDQFFKLQESENIISLNHFWLRNHKNLQVLDIKLDEMLKRVKAIAQSFPDHEKRAEEALNAEPRYMRIIRALCKETGQILDRITAADPAHTYKGETIIAWHFITDNGHYYMIDANEEAIMFDGSSKKIVERIKVTK